MLEQLLFDSSSEDEIVPRQPRIRRRKIYRPRINFNYLSNIEFQERFRMSSTKLNSLELTLGRYIAHPSRQSGSLSSRQQLCIALHWFGSGSQYHVIGDMHGVSKATVCRCVRTVVEAVCNRMFKTEVSWPRDMGSVVNQFYIVANFPQVCGVIDGSLISIDSPSENEEAFVDRHGKHSLNCMFVCGPSSLFYCLNARWPGSVHDSRVLRNSSFYRRMETGSMPFPNGVLLGDSAYPLKRWLMTPLHHNPNDPAENIYNPRLKATGQTVERALGILKEKFPCLNHLRLRPSYAAKVVICCTTLCNFARKDDPTDDFTSIHNDTVEIENDNILT